MTIDWSFLDEFRVDSYEDAMELVKELEIEIKKLAKKLKRAFKNLGETLRAQLGRQVKGVAELLKEAFTVDSMAQLSRATSLYGAELAGALYQLQVKLSQFRIALIRAAEPLVRLLLPAVQAAVQALTGLANAFGQVLRFLLFGTEGADNFSDSVQGAASAGKSLKRTLAGFDQLNRLGGSSGGIFSGISAAPLTGQWQKIADKLIEIIRPLREMDLTPAAESLAKLVKALEPIKKELFSGLEWAWKNLLLPLAQWTAEELLPVFLDTLTTALQALATVIEQVRPLFTWLWEQCLQPLAQWAGDRVIGYLQTLSQELMGVGGWISDNIGPVDKITNLVSSLIQNVGNLILQFMGWDSAAQGVQGSLSTLLGSLLTSDLPFGKLLTSLSGIAEATGMVAGGFDTIGTASSTTWELVQNLWGGLWAYLKEKLADPAYEGIRTTINGIIALVNSVLNGLAKAFNFVAGTINGMGITIPEWVPVIGGKRFEFNLGTVTPPQIPYLAKGAVLPANKPFLAVVGDQRHGTNVEAPLTTIEEAVAKVMDHQLGGIMAGFEAVVQRQEQILEAVLGIDISDAAIAGAAERHQRKMAIVMGGY